MTKLNQIIAVEKGIKNEIYAKFTELHQIVQKAPLLSGISRTYQPKDDEGDVFPSESTRVQIKAEHVLDDVATILSRLFDIVAIKDATNCVAKSDVVVGGSVLLKDVPATHLLFLEKQLNDLHTFVKKLPTHDPSDVWTFNQSTDFWVTPVVKTVKTKKIPRNHVKAEATDKHPAQVEIWYEDVVVGHWSTIKFSGAMPAKRVNELIERVEILREAVKFAREQANMADIIDQSEGEVIFRYLFGK